MCAWRLRIGHPGVREHGRWQSLQSGVNLDQGSRFRWSSGTGDVRALESADESTRRAATWFHSTEVQATVSFTDAYVGMMRIYMVDWDSTVRRQTVTVNDGSGPQSVTIDRSFNGGAWVEFPINVGAAGSVSITVTKDGGSVS